MDKDILIVGFEDSAHLLKLVKRTEGRAIYRLSLQGVKVAGTESCTLIDALRGDFGVIVTDFRSHLLANRLADICGIEKVFNLESKYYSSRQRFSTPRLAARDCFRETEAMRESVVDGAYDVFRPNYWISGWAGYSRNYVDGFRPYADYLIGAPDYPRLHTVNELSRQLDRKGCSGAVAELGVYRGDFSSYLSSVFEEEPLYLFDTFEGFDENDVLLDKGFSESVKRHLSETSVSTVSSKLNNPDRCVFAVGRFPDTSLVTRGVSFKFVSIDVDLYEPTRAGLEVFYPLLVPGGYIMIHDYFHPSYRGPKKAVDEFCDRLGIPIFPVSDFYGSVLIAK